MLGFRPEGTGERAPVRYFKFDCPKQADDVGEWMTPWDWTTPFGRPLRIASMRHVISALATYVAFGKG